MSGSAVPGPPAVLVMAKAPVPGRVKTRLHPLLGPDGSAALQAALITHTCELTCGQGLRTYLAYDPPGADGQLRALVPAEVRLLPQRGGHLGARLRAAVEDVSGRHGGPLVVLGTDAPTLTGRLLADAFAMLAADGGIVLGPALDGGYYLIGMRRPDPRLFGIDPRLWSGDQVLAATAALAHGYGLRTSRLRPLPDLDTPDDAALHLADPLLPATVAAALRAPAPAGPSQEG